MSSRFHLTAHCASSCRHCDPSFVRKQVGHDWHSVAADEILATLLDAQRAVYVEDAEAAKALIEVGDSAPVEGLDPSVLAAWTVVSSAVLNLHEAITKG